MGIFVVMLLAVDGGGAYAPVIDYEWPGSPTSMLQLVSDDAAQLADGGRPVGWQTLRGWDGGAIVDSQGVYFVRGPVNVWANISAGLSGWPDVSAGGRYEVCHVPSWDSTQWRDGQAPGWDGTSYLFDANQVTQHTVAVMFGHLEKGNLYVRVNGSAVTTIDIPGVVQQAGQAYCTSVEWLPVGSGFCAIWVRHDSCAQTPVRLCTASTVVGFDTSGAGACPSNATYITLANRQYGYDSTNVAPTTVHVGAIRVGVK